MRGDRIRRKEKHGGGKGGIRGGCWHWKLQGS